MVRRASGGHPSREEDMKLQGMKLQPLLLALTAINVGLFAYTISQQAAQAAPANDGILRGKGLQIVDNGGQVRASISIHPAEKLKDGSTYPETVLLRLITPDGRPSVKLSTTQAGSGFSFTDGAGLSYVQLLVQNDDPQLNIVDKVGKKISTLP
jgi:hypothetical protein